MVTVEDLIKYDTKDALNFIKELLDSNSISIKHPKLDVATFPRESKIKEMVNVIHFSDENLNNHWYYIQITKLINGYYIPDEDLVNPRNMPGVEAVKRWLDKGELKFDLERNLNKVDGLVFSQKRPYHYFYDQFVNYFKLSSTQNIDDYCFSDDTCFYSETKSITFKKIKMDGCYFYPCTVPGNYDDSDATKMHDFLKSNVKQVDIKSDLTIWLGVTGQKRSWVEQVEGYVSIIKKLNSNFSNITVIIDGWSNYENDNSINEEDNEVFALIESQLYSLSSVRLINLISKSYKTKIAYANACDYFIANSGTGCMVPFMISKLKGVIHGNGQLNTFERCYNKYIRVIPKEKISAEKSSETMNNSYSIAWETIYNLLMDLMGSTERLSESKLRPNSKIVFSHLNFTDKTDPAGALRDIAVLFDKIGDRETAYNLMCKALEQRPSGPFIKQKIEEWKPKLLK